MSQDVCFFHGHEPITDETYIVCGECWHAWTARELLDAHNALLDELGIGGERETEPQAISTCPLCIHDF